MIITIITPLIHPCLPLFYSICHKAHVHTHTHTHTHTSSLNLSCALLSILLLVLWVQTKWMRGCKNLENKISFPYRLIISTCIFFLKIINVDIQTDARLFVCLYINIVTLVSLHPVPESFWVCVWCKEMNYFMFFAVSLDSAKEEQFMAQDCFLSHMCDLAHCNYSSFFSLFCAKILRKLIWGCAGSYTNWMRIF